MSSTIHDSGYKKLFSNRTIFRQLLETFVDQPWVKDLDFSRCETVDKSFVSDHYKETESDLIYKIGLHDETIFIYILIEFQSSIQRFMAVRVLNYVSSFYLDYIASTKRIAKLPAVFPIVLYNGERRWSAPQSVAELVEEQPKLGDYGIQFKYLLLDEKAYSQEQLLRIRNIVSMLFLTEGHYDIGQLEEELVNLYDQETDKQAISLFLNWLRYQMEYGRLRPEDYAEIERVYLSKEEVRTMFAANMERQRAKWREEGRVEGRAEGRAVGVREALETQIVRVITRRFGMVPETVRQTLPALSVEELQTIFDAAIDAHSLAEFEARLPIRRQ